MSHNIKREQLRIGILGHGNLGRGIEMAVMQNPDMVLAGIFTRRDPSSIKPMTPNVTVYPVNHAISMKDAIDVMILCGGSATDLIEQSPEFARNFNIVDSFDTHAKVPEHFETVNSAAVEGGNVAIISVGWDPGLFSLNRLYAEAALPVGISYTFWGDGVSQGHSDAIRRISGVENAVQYTLPIKDAIEKVRSGSNPVFTTREKHTRLCYVVATANADQEAIRNEIVNMPDYFSDYNTTVNFISAEELAKNHSTMPHGGFVMRSGATGTANNTTQIYEFSLKLDSNPEFTASVITSYARAAARLSAEGTSGAKTVFDIAPSYISPKSASELRKELL